MIAVVVVHSSHLASSIIPISSLAVWSKRPDLSLDRSIESFAAACLRAFELGGSGHHGPSSWLLVVGAEEAGVKAQRLP